MKTRSLAAALAVALVPAGVSAAPQPPPGAISKLADAIPRAANTDNASGLATIFTDDAVVVDVGGTLDESVQQALYKLGLAEQAVAP